MAQWAILLARTDPGAVKHAGLTYFLCDLTGPGVDVRPLRQITVEAEYHRLRLAELADLPDPARGQPASA